MEWRVW